MSRSVLIRSASYDRITPLRVVIRVTEGATEQAFRFEKRFPEHSTREARVRILSALASMGAPLNRGYLVEIIEGPERWDPAYDLPIVVGILELREVTGFGLYSSFFGELSLTGEIRPTRGAAVRALAWEPHVSVVSAPESAREVRVSASPWRGFRTLPDLISGICSTSAASALPEPEEGPRIPNNPKFLEALEAAGETGRVLLVGVPGSGKTIIARALTTIDAPSEEERATIAKIYSAAGLPPPSGRPFRAPHYTVSEAGMLGDARRPGEVSLAHGGVLFLDELPEFRRTVLEGARIAPKLGRAEGWPSVPRVVVASANPCPCGHKGNSRRECRCSPEMVQRYRERFAFFTEGFTEIAIEPFKVGDV